MAYDYTDYVDTSFDVPLTVDDPGTTPYAPDFVPTDTTSTPGDGYTDTSFDVPLSGDTTNQLDLDELQRETQKQIWGTPPDAAGLSFLDQLKGIPDYIQNALKAKFLKPGTTEIDWGKVASTGAGLVGAYKAYTDAEKSNKPVGYQGGIPSYTAVQGRADEPVAGSRPGAGHQYFTGIKFAPAGGLPAAQTAIDTQVTGLNALNAANALARRPVNTETAPATIAAPENTVGTPAINNKPLEPNYAQEGIMSLARGGVPTRPHGTYLKGDTDGMADKIPGTIDGIQPARLAHGEFVIPADVVSHLGNGNSDAGAKQLYKMMDRIRMARTGSEKQGKEINPSKFMPGGLASYAAGGVARFAAGDEITTPKVPAVPATASGSESNLSTWAGPYVTDLMGKTQALTSAALEKPQFYQGELTAGPSALQNKAFGEAGNLTGQSFTNAGTAASYMSPYMQNVVDIQKREAARQSGIQGTQQQAQAVQAGAFGGGRDAIQRAERERNLGTQMNDIQAQGLQAAYQAAQGQYNTEQNKNLANINLMAGLGGTQQQTEQAGLAAAQAQFEQQKADPYKQLQFQQSMLQGMPLQTQSYSTTTNPYSAAAAGATGTSALFKSIFG